MLKELVQERLMAAADEIFALFERTIASYEEELSRTREEKKRHRQQLEAASKTHNKDFQQLIGPTQTQGRISTLKQKDPRPSCIKEEEVEPQPPLLKEEEFRTPWEGECLPDLTEIRKTVVSVKTEDHKDKSPESSPLRHSPSEGNKGAEPPSCSMTTGDPRGAPLSSEPLSSDTDWEGDIRTQTDNRHFDRSKKYFTCTFCAKRFTLKTNLTQHLRTHTGEKPFSCLICRSTFSRRSTLKRHTGTHAGEKPFGCSICHNRFAQKTALASHMRTHTGEKPFGCSVCGNRFSHKSYLVSHMRTHTGEKPFRCSVCGSTFSQRSTLKRHLRTHAGGNTS
ncbi:uncharacterized protein [Nerophis lumbriciformis]|uniref:uncharacterized protein n=1 Tax=Nerophis lumbriciformis TaxID=546530 RepID=UPI002ADF15CB|nr:zinc finger protein 771-like [Nerophis lumbriciformis]